MQDNKSEMLCPCESGFKFSDCCGFEGRTAINADMLAKTGADGSVVEGELNNVLVNALKDTATSPDMFLARYNFLEERAYMVKMSPRWYEESVFLDPGRMKGTCVIEANFEWLASITSSVQQQAMPIIFHSAFCGSTLMSRALDTVFNSLPVREPECLGNVLELLRSDLKTDAFKNDWLNIVLKLLAKRYDDEQPVIVKTNDYANPMMSEILSRYDNMPSLFMYTPLAEFVASCLKAPNRLEWIKGRYHSSMEYAQPLFAADINSMVIDAGSYSEMAAFYWSYNMALYCQVWDQFPDKIRSLNFTDMLDEPVQAIITCGHWFGLETKSGGDVQEKIDQTFGVYSKNSSVKYSSQQRRDDIAQQQAGYKVEIKSAERLARQLLGKDYPARALPGKLF